MPNRTSGCMNWRKVVYQVSLSHDLRIQMKNENNGQEQRGGSDDPFPLTPPASSGPESD